MAKKKGKTVSRRMWLIDPIYRKFTAQAFKNLTGTEFYSFFMTMLQNGEHEFQFSNRKLDMQVDERWVEIIEATIPAFMEISRNPRVIITQEELITNVVQARKIDSQVVRHLCAHSYLVESIDENEEVRPSKVLNIFKEESWNTYENRFVYTLMKKTHDFITKRYRDMKDAMNDEYGATLLIKSTGNSALETLSIDTKLKITQTDDLFDTENKQDSIFARIQHIYEAMCNLMETRFAKEMAKYPKVDPPLVSTNAIKKNPYLRKCHKLWDFLLTYFDVGYTIQIIEQNPEINQKFEQDIFDNIMFTYIILKGYLEDNRDRAMDKNVKSQRHTLRPRYIKEIVEDIVRDFNLPDVEVRKILIEQLTKEQLMREERSEQYRLIAEKRKMEQDKKRQAEMERIRRAKERERQKRLMEKERAKEKARLEKEKAKEAEKLRKEKEKKAELDAKNAAMFEQELTMQLEGIEARRKRNEAGQRRAAKKTAAARPKKSAKTAAAAEKKATGEKKKPAAKKIAAKKPAEKAEEKNGVQPQEEQLLPAVTVPDEPMAAVQAAEKTPILPDEPVQEQTVNTEADTPVERAENAAAEEAAATEPQEPAVPEAEEIPREAEAPSDEPIAEEAPVPEAEVSANDPIAAEIASVVESVMEKDTAVQPKESGRFKALKKILGRKQ